MSIEIASHLLLGLWDIEIASHLLIGLGEIEIASHLLIGLGEIEIASHLLKGLVENIPKYTVKKRFASFPSPAGMSLPNSPWAGIMTS
jgi:hypothetical protein